MQISGYFPVDSDYSLYYYPDINRFIDEDGNIWHSLHKVFHEWEIEKWKNMQDYGIMHDKEGHLVELYYHEPFYYENNI